MIEIEPRVIFRVRSIGILGNFLANFHILSLHCRLEEDLAARYSNSDIGMEDELKGSRRGSGLTRRSFFKRKKHQRNNSKDSRDLSSISDASINSDSVPFLDGKKQHDSQ